jgi:hypothetical protein
MWQGACRQFSDFGRGAVKMLSPNCVLPANGLPQTGYPPCSELEWIDLDPSESQNARGGRPLYPAGSIIYRFNSFGYRCPEFDTVGDLRIVAVGCSLVMGIGLPQDELFHERFAKRLAVHTGKSVVHWNLGLPRASNDYITRTLFLALPFLKPDIVLVNFTHLSRREYVSVENRMIPYHVQHCEPDYVGREICNHLKALSSPYDDEVNFFRNYKAVEALLSDQCWFFSVPESENEIFYRLIHHVDADRFAGNIRWLDTARDNMHPGAISHAQLEESYWNKFLRCGI